MKEEAVFIDIKYRVNHQIRVREVRVIDHEGNQLGVIPTRKAMEIAEEAGLDLVEVAPEANPPVCKIMDYGKFKYDKEKKAKISRRNQKIADLKELKMRPKIDEHDYQVKLKSALRFLQDGDRVKFTIRFRGRELTFKEKGVEILERVMTDLREMTKLEQTLKEEGRNITITLAPKK
ncbi:MAG TPA: translation initiation factor IF-3 [Atribacteraceae bacterium]|nr:translation initiation factor IF-3 [Atribacteraceae bacterium]